MTTRYVYDFSEGDKEQKDLLGGKGANLAEMVKIGLPVPPGFTITTEACKAYLTKGKAPAELAAEVTEQVRLLCAMRFTYDELAYLRSLRFLKSDFVDFLSIFQL